MRPAPIYAALLFAAVAATGGGAPARAADPADDAPPDGPVISSFAVQTPPPDDAARPRLADEDPTVIEWRRRAADAPRAQPEGAMDMGPRIAYADEVATGAFRQVVALVNNAGDTTCTGVLIGRDVVLTAAHCVCADYRPVRAVIGETVANKVRDIPVTRLNVPGGVDHAAGLETCRKSARGRDYMILRLKTNVPQGEMSAPARLVGSAQSGAIHRGATALAVGFGFDELLVSGIKRRGAVPITQPRCPPRNGAHGCKPHEMIAQAAQSERHHRPQSQCVGDSGGPIYVVHDGRYWVAGLLSRGWNVDGREPQCGDLAIYTKITAHVRRQIVANCSQTGAEDCPDR